MSQTSAPTIELDRGTVANWAELDRFYSSTSPAWCYCRRLAFSCGLCRLDETNEAVLRLLAVHLAQQNRELKDQIVRMLEQGYPITATTTL